MTHSRTTILTLSGLALVLLVGCASVARAPGTTPLSEIDPGSPGTVPFNAAGHETPRVGLASSCHRARKPNEVPTGPIATIVIDHGSLKVLPDTIVQPVGTGFVGWQIGSSDISVAQVTYKGDSPLGADHYVIPVNRVVGSTVRQDAECKDYAYGISVIMSDGTTKKLDPDTDIIPN